MCPRCEGMGTVNDIDLTQLYDDSKSINEGALTIPGYTPDGWGVRIFAESGFVDGDKPIHDFTTKSCRTSSTKSRPRSRSSSMNLTYQGLVPKIQKSFLSKDVEAMQPHIRAFVERAVTFTACPECGGTRLSAAARSSKIKGINIADACAMQISDLAEWVRELDGAVGRSPARDPAADARLVRAHRPRLPVARPHRRARCRAARRSAPR